MKKHSAVYNAVRAFLEMYFNFKRYQLSLTKKKKKKKAGKLLALYLPKLYIEVGVIKSYYTQASYST